LFNAMQIGRVTMSNTGTKTPQQGPEDLTKMDQAKTRRATLKKLGRFATVTAPTVTLLLAAQTKPNRAATPSPCKSNCSFASSRALKTAKVEIDTASVLAGVAALPLDSWRYKPETGLEQQTHIGPYAEDFRRAFGVGDGVTISTIDAVGVCLAAIKALSDKVESLEAELQRPRRETVA
jgi:hypothetical protein